MSDEPEIERCVCGEEAMLHAVQRPLHTEWRVECLRRDGWSGPVCATKDAAITQWNPLMRAARERARLQDELDTAHSDIIDECGRVITADGTVYAAEMPTAEATAAWILGGRAPGTMPTSRCTCPDCTEHRARVTAPGGAVGSAEDGR